MSTAENLIPIIRNLVADAIVQTFEIGDNTPEISYPDARFGDYTTNAAFALAKTLKKAPNQIAEQLAAAISHPDIDEAIAVNGFVNLKMHQNWWIKQLTAINRQFGTLEIGSNRKVQVEFISANPTGPLTLGNARGGYVGDVLARVLQRAGYQVTREYYFNNAGTQIRTLVASVKAAAGLIPKEDKHYPGAYIEDLAREYADDLKTKNDAELGLQITNAIFERYIRPAIDKMGIDYDHWFNESDLITSGALEETLSQLAAKKLTYERDGALWLATEALGADREERVLRKSNGDYTYLATDLAYHHNIFAARQMQRSIKVWGADHSGQVDSLQLAVRALLPEAKLEFLILQWVRLMRGGQEVKMSKRAGTFVTVEELVDEVGSDVARYLFLMRSTDTPMDFDLEVAKEQSQKNPLFYVMYSYARANSLLEQAALRKLTPLSTVESLSQPEIALIRHLSRFPDLIAELAASFEVHKLTFFGQQAATLFHDLYESERIIDLDKAEACKRLYVVDRYHCFMLAYFDTLGIKPVERMNSLDNAA